MPTNPPANPLPGAVYVDQTTNISWVWTGTYWLQAYGGSSNYTSQQTPTTAIIPGYYAEPSPDSWFPSVGATAPAYPSCGQIWVDNSVTPNYAQVWDCNTSTWIQLGGVPGGDTNSIVSAVAPTIRVSGDALQSGDFWLNPANNGLSYWNGANWVQISTPDTHTIYSSLTPATRYNGDTLVPGDLWTDPDDNALRYWNGIQWAPVVAIDNDHQLSATPPTLRPDGSGLLVADLYTNTASGTLFYWDGVAWVRYNDTHCFHATVQPAARPDGSLLEGGDQWFNPTTDELYVWDATSSSWVLVTTSNSHSWWSATAPATRPDGTALVNGDMWTDSTMNTYGSHPLKVWHISAWHSVGEKDTHSFLGTVNPNGVVISRPDTTALLDGDIHIDTVTQQGYYYNTATSSWTGFGTDTHAFLGNGDPLVVNPTSVRPNGTSLQDGDIYIDKASKQAWYYDTSVITWSLFGSDTHSFVGAGLPTAVAPFSAGNRPSGTTLKAGDQYLDTNSKILYSWDGAAWVGVSSDNHSIPSATQPTVRPDTSVLQDGDQWVNTSFNPSIEYTYTAGAWQPHGDVTVVTALPAAGEFPNQLLVNSTTNRMYRWDLASGNTWVQVA